jgi:hypothetical protein
MGIFDEAWIPELIWLGDLVEKAFIQSPSLKINCTFDVYLTIVAYWPRKLPFPLRNNPMM